MALSEPTIEAAPLAAADLPDAEALVREAGWNQVAADWEIFRALGTVYVARDQDHADPGEFAVGQRRGRRHHASVGAASAHGC